MCTVAFSRAEGARASWGKVHACIHGLGSHPPAANHIESPCVTNEDILTVSGGTRPAAEGSRQHPGMWQAVAECRGESQSLECQGEVSVPDLLCVVPYRPRVQPHDALAIVTDYATLQPAERPRTAAPTRNCQLLAHQQCWLLARRATTKGPTTGLRQVVALRTQGQSTDFKLGGLLSERRIERVATRIGWATTDGGQSPIGLSRYHQAATTMSATWSATGRAEGGRESGKRPKWV